LTDGTFVFSGLEIVGVDVWKSGRLVRDGGWVGRVREGSFEAEAQVATVGTAIPSVIES
jgi:hypothetical protein